MITNIRILLTDEERSTLADLIDGKTSKRLATRAEVSAMAEAVFAHLNAEQAAPAATPDLSLVPDKYADKPDAWKLGWLRGRYVLRSYRT